MPRPSLIITRQIPIQGLELLKSHGDVAVWEHDSVVHRDWLLEHIRRADGVLCLLTDHIDQVILDAAPGLKVVSTMAVGFDNVDVKECTRRGIPVGHTPGVLTETTADFAFALLMAAARRIVEGAQYVQRGEWKTWSPTLLLGQDLYGATIGIVGFGRIGQAVARRAKGFGMRILACRSTCQHVLQGERKGNVELTDLHTVLAESDFVSLHVPLTKETFHMISKSEITNMKNSAILVNTARGAVVDPQALYEGLVDGEIAYAALDVTEPEPIPMDHPLLALQNCLIVPHIASASTATRTKMAVMAAQNVLAGLTGQPLPYCVNPEVYG